MPCVEAQITYQPQITALEVTAGPRHCQNIEPIVCTGEELALTALSSRCAPCQAARQLSIALKCRNATQ